MPPAPKPQSNPQLPGGEVPQAIQPHPSSQATVHAGGPQTFAVGSKVHVSGTVTAVNGDELSIRLDAPVGKGGEEVKAVHSSVVHAH